MLQGGPVPFPAIEPYETGMLDAGDGNLIYWEACGKPDGVPALIVHGGPGSGCTTTVRSAFDPERYRIILFDQRNYGRSRPTPATPRLVVHWSAQAYGTHGRVSTFAISCVVCSQP